MNKKQLESDNKHKSILKYVKKMKYKVKYDGLSNEN
jgi:hypothetical protein